MDPRENLIHQWLALDTSLGETAEEFQPSQNPPLETWKIIATVNTETSAGVRRDGVGTKTKRDSNQN
ncbi:hypothetical protein AMELA_G00280170 [Ameiurus melas]|uniref:Uncharacterized protein n=1 Tax=Ameiurus melas TaxID=219545 RepID=A0A7J5ZMC4_AMEME|nr:hypothetical protein AMELA_G00280170 [Ameiurus melas]